MYKNKYIKKCICIKKESILEMYYMKCLLNKVFFKSTISYFLVN